ncbi:MAG TPA: GTP cyclohydrolase I [Solirubrobacteraceae bacterium]
MFLCVELTVALIDLNHGPVRRPYSKGTTPLVINDRALWWKASCQQPVLDLLEAEHMCMSLRGVQKFGARTITSALHGLVRDDPRTRQEFLALTTRSEP